MTEKTFTTGLGNIHYWTNKIKPDEKTLIFLPGLTADHRLFDKQIEYFESKCNVLVWDAPGHAASRPFDLSFSLPDKAKWLNEILKIENITKPIIDGQSMGGYVGQVFIQEFPGVLKGFISIDSAPLQRKYVTGMEIWLLKRMEPIYKIYPWKSLIKAGSKGVAVTKYGQQLMADMMAEYKDKAQYSHLVGRGYQILAEAMEADLPYKIDCPALLIVGKQDHAGSCIRYNKSWHADTNIPIEWIDGAGHNSNTDQPEIINKLIEDFYNKI